MRLASALASFAVVGIGFWSLWHYTAMGDLVQSYVENGEILTLEARYSASQIMQAHRDKLLQGEKYSYKDPILKFYPYLLMEVKYPQLNGKTKEGVILWSMVDGEMVMDAETWQTTHGFEDAINAGATSADFQILNTLATYRGVMQAQKLQAALNVDDRTMKQMLDNVLYKHLVMMRGDEVVLHFQDPRFHVIPDTKLSQSLVTKPYSLIQKVGKRYTQSQIERTAKAAFGHDFAIRNSRIVFLPVYGIEVQNPDGSVKTTYRNALTAQAMK